MKKHILYFFRAVTFSKESCIKIKKPHLTYIWKSVEVNPIICVCPVLILGVHDKIENHFPIFHLVICFLCRHPLQCIKENPNFPDYTFYTKISYH